MVDGIFQRPRTGNRDDLSFRNANGGGPRPITMALRFDRNRFRAVKPAREINQRASYIFYLSRDHKRAGGH